MTENQPLERYWLAIDVGTSNTCASVLRPGASPTPLHLGYSSNSMPSAVLISGDRVAVGDDALRMAAMHPTGLERTPKRRLGEPLILLDGLEVRPVDLVASVMRRVLTVAAQQSRGSAPSRVVITHPAAWGPHLLDRLREAAALAGLSTERVVLIAEPLAAAWRHVENGAIALGEDLAVVDFGGGTFDVACLSTVTSPHGLDLRVGTIAGIDPLGGDDFDELIERWVRDQLVSDGRQDLLRQLDSPGGLASRLTLRDEITRAKHDLSHHSSAPLAVVLGAERLILTISAAEFEQMIRPAVSRAVVATRTLLGGREVQHLFLTGGSSLIPLVQREFQELTKGRVGTLGDPKEVTSAGALIAAEELAGPLAEGGSTHPQESPNRRRRWGPAVAAGVVALGVLVGGGGVWAWASSSDSGTGTVAEDPPGCPGLSSQECDLVTAHSELVEEGSCSPEPIHDAAVLLSVKCTPATTTVTLAGTPVMYLTKVGSDGDSTRVIGEFLQGVGVDLSSQAASDVRIPPAWNTWAVGGGSELGTVYSLWEEKTSSAHLVWTYTEKHHIVQLASSNGDVANLYDWWTSTVPKP